MSDCNVSWSEKKSLGSTHEVLNNYGTPIRRNNYIKDLSNSPDAKCLRIKMNVVDSRNCRGPSVNTTIPLTEPSKNVS